MSEGKSNKFIMILLILLVILFIGVAAAFGYFYFFKNKNTNGTVQPKKVIEKTVSAEETIVNLADEDAKVYIKTKIFLGYTGKNVDKEITEALPQIKDIINTYLRTKKSQDFKGDGVEKVRKELLDRINTVFNEPKVTNIYFYEIIIQ